MDKTLSVVGQRLVQKQFAVHLKQQLSFLTTVQTTTGKDTDINQRQQKMWNDSHMFTFSTFLFQRRPI